MTGAASEASMTLDEERRIRQRLRVVRETCENALYGQLKPGLALELIKLIVEAPLGEKVPP